MGTSEPSNGAESEGLLILIEEPGVGVAVAPVVAGAGVEDLVGQGLDAGAKSQAADSRGNVVVEEAAANVVVVVVVVVKEAAEVAKETGVTVARLLRSCKEQRDVIRGAIYLAVHMPDLEKMQA